MNPFSISQRDRSLIPICLSPKTRARGSNGPYTEKREVICVICVFLCYVKVFGFPVFCLGAGFGVGSWWELSTQYFCGSPFGEKPVFGEISL